MERLQKVRLISAILIASFLMTFSYELKKIFNIQTKFFFLIAIVVSFILSNILINFIPDLFLKIKFFRRIIFGRNFIEGYWLITTMLDEGKENLLIGEIALGQISFINSDIGFETVTCRFSDDISKSKFIYSYSSSVILDLSNLSYINFNRIGYTDKIIDAVGYGKFLSSPGEKQIDLYDGMVVTFDGKHPARQRANKIDDREIIKYKNKYKEKWMEDFLLKKKRGNMQEFLTKYV
jgi:hypothetical protein